MKSRIITKLVCLGLAGVMAAGSLFAVPRTVEPCASTNQTASPNQAEDWDFRAEASMLLQEVQSTAALLSREAATLHSFARGGLSWETHVSQVTVVKDHINAIGQRLDRLQAIRHVAAPWQRQAIDSIVPAAASVAAHTEAAIQHLNERGQPLWAPAYTNHLEAISERSNFVKESVDLHLKIAGTQEKLEQLRDRASTLGS